MAREASHAAAPTSSVWKWAALRLHRSAAAPDASRLWWKKRSCLRFQHSWAPFFFFFPRWIRLSPLNRLGWHFELFCSISTPPSRIIFPYSRCLFGVPACFPLLGSQFSGFPGVICDIMALWHPAKLLLPCFFGTFLFTRLPSSDFPAGWNEQPPSLQQKPACCALCPPCGPVTFEGCGGPDGHKTWRVGTFAFPAQVLTMANEPVILNVYDMVRVHLRQIAFPFFSLEF